MPESDQKAEAELRRIADPFLNEQQLSILLEAVGCGLRPLPNEE